MDVTDGTSRTIMVVEANDKKAVYWTQPEDFPIDTKEPLEGLVNPELKGFLAALRQRFGPLPTRLHPPSDLASLVYPQWRRKR